MSTVADTRPSLPQLALEEWEDTKDTLHLWLQIVGKVRLASTTPRNHWWHAPLYVDVRGLTTRRMHASSGIAFEIRFDFIDHRLVIATNGGQVEAFDLVDDLSVAEFDQKLHGALHRLGIAVTITEIPYRLPTETPFPKDGEHAAYDRDAVERFWRILDWSDGVLEEFAGWYCGKTSPVHLFWHGLDLAVTRFSGKRAQAPAAQSWNTVDRETYTHEVISFGFWFGDDKVREATYYSYTFPEPAGLREQPLRPGEAVWAEDGRNPAALLPYEAVRAAADPTAALLAFLESTYQAGASTAGWDVGDLASSWCPSQPELTALLER
jgi:Family of unknown function (DUF5996)